MKDIINTPGGTCQAIESGYASCLKCGFVLYLGEEAEGYCTRCNEKVMYRLPQSLTRSIAFLIAAVAMFIPANVLPVMTMKMIGEGETATIMDGIIVLFHHGSPGIAIIVFVASILVPLLKLTGMSILIATVHFGWNARIHEKMLLYRIVEWIGRWSMLDIFVITVLVALVDLGRLASVIPGKGASCFSLLVILTMFSARFFDTRLIWDMNRKCINEVNK